MQTFSLHLTQKLCTLVQYFILCEGTVRAILKEKSQQNYGLGKDIFIFFSAVTAYSEAAWGGMNSSAPP